MQVHTWTQFDLHCYVQVYERHKMTIMINLYVLILLKYDTYSYLF